MFQLFVFFFLAPKRFPLRDRGIFSHKKKIVIFPSFPPKGFTYAFEGHKKAKPDHTIFRNPSLCVGTVRDPVPCSGPLTLP